MSRRTAEANKAVRLAWQREYDLIQEGKGTRDWTKEQQEDILDPNKGRAYDDKGKAFEGQHMKSVEKYPEYQGDPDNIQFLTRQEHLEAHQGNWQNPTNWYYNPVTKLYTNFGEGKYIPALVIELTEPIITYAKLEDVVFKEFDSIVSKQDDKMTEEPRAPFSMDKSNSIAKASVVKAQVETERTGFFKRIIGDVAKGLKKAGKFVVEHKDVIGVVALAVSGAMLEEKIRNNNFGSGNTDEYLPYDDNDSSCDYEKSTIVENDLKTEFDFTDMEEQATHSSPCEHEVREHSQRYHTKNGVEWRKKALYPRGGKKDDD